METAPWHLRLSLVFLPIFVPRGRHDTASDFRKVNRQLREVEVEISHPSAMICEAATLLNHF
jgi:hypothetical protein